MDQPEKEAEDRELNQPNGQFDGDPTRDRGHHVLGRSAQAV